MAAEAAAMVARHGFRTLKVKGGQSLEVDVAGMQESALPLGTRFASMSTPTVLIRRIRQRIIPARWRMPAP